MKRKLNPQNAATTPAHTSTNEPLTLDLVKELRSTAKHLYEESTLYHIADLLTQSADKLEAAYQAAVFMYSNKEVPEDVRRKLL